MAVEGGDETSLEFTPTWVVALVCFCIVFISITVDGFFRRAGKLLKKRNTWLLIDASRKIKDELMLLGLISLLLAAFQTRIGKICISEQLNDVWLPCKKPDSSSTVATFTTSSFPSSGTRGRRLLAIASYTTNYCSEKGKVPLLSVEAVHHLHIFIFVLATFHVVLCLLKVLSMIWQWRNLEIYDEMLKPPGSLLDYALKNLRQSYENPPGFVLSVMFGMLQGITSMSLFEYMALRGNFTEVRLGTRITSMSPLDDVTLCLSFFAAQSRADFQKYIMRTLQKEFEKMIGISWYLWLFSVMFLLLNVAGWHAYFWISFIPLILWLIVHFKLEGMIRRLVKAFAEKLRQSEEESIKNSAESVFEFSDDDFLFGKPDLVGNLIHFVLFENSLQLAFFFFTLLQYGFHSCIMGKVGFVVPRIAIGVMVQLLCMSRTLPLYAIIKSQMHLKGKQSGQADKQHKISKIKMHLEEYLSNEHIKKCLGDLDEIKKRLKENGMDEEEEMRIVTWISELIDNRKEPNSLEESTNIQPTRTGSREGSAGDETTEASGVNPIKDIEAQNQTTKPAPTIQINEIMD